MFKNNKINLINKYKLLIIISILLFLGFFLTSFFSYTISMDLTKNQLRYKSLPLSSDNIYSEIQNDLLKPNLISSIMSQDTFMINWIVNGEKDLEEIKTYLGTIKNQYNTSTSFLVSDKTKNYYYYDGILKKINAKNKTDQWYFRLKNNIEIYESNIDLDASLNNTSTIFTNYKVKDSDGNFLGVIGVGLKTSKVSELLNTYKNKYHHNIYLINKDNKVFLSSYNISKLNHDLKHKSSLNNIINNYIKDNNSIHEYYKDGKKQVLNIRYIKELDLYLIVEAQEKFFTKELERTFYLNILAFSIIIFIIMALIIYYINHSHDTLNEFANTDELTSLINRNSFDKTFKMKFTKNKEKLTLLLFDIDNFKEINDGFGHLIGDKVLARVSYLFKNTFREHDLIARWGGDEFIALLPNVNTQSTYTLSQRLKVIIQEDELLNTLIKKPLTISMGIITRDKESNIEELFIKVDEKLYQAKKEGKNKIIY